MTWQSRLREAAYTPAGNDGPPNRITFDYENVRETRTKKGSAREFVDADGTYIQGTGNTGRRYPMRVFFWGPDYDIESQAFMDAIAESGIGKLEHPIYGTVDVVPLGEVTRRDNLKTGANQAIFELTFFETIGLVYPTPQGDPASAVTAAVDAYNVEAGLTLEEETSLDSAIEQVTFKNDYSTLQSVSVNALRFIADATEAVQKQFDAITDSITRTLDAAVGDVVTLGVQTAQLLQTPSKAVTTIQERLATYRLLLDQVTTGSNAVSTPGNDSVSSNQFHTRDLYASTYVTGSIDSTVNNQFVTKREAIEAAEEILLQFAQVAAWRDDNYQSLGEIDTGESYQKLQEAVAIAAGFLVEISFTLKQERRIELDRARTIIDLVGELYGTVDSELDFFITSNDLSGSEILEIPKGREVVYYV